MAIDYVVLFGPDAGPYDPCSLLGQLRPAYMKLLIEGGAGETEITFRDRTVKFAKPDIKGLETLIRRLESECAAKQGFTTGRAMSAGYRNTWGDE